MHVSLKLVLYMRPGRGSQSNISALHGNVAAVLVAPIAGAVLGATIYRFVGGEQG